MAERARVLVPTRISPALRDRIRSAAREAGISANAWQARAWLAALSDETVLSRSGDAGGTAGFLGWLAGFIDGEGCFTISRSSVRGVQRGYRCRLTIRLRLDDKPILVEIAQRTGLGTVRRDEARSQNAQAVWEVASKDACSALCELLDRYPLRAKKAADYAIWREAVEAWRGISVRNGETGPHPAQAQMAELKTALESGRAYNGASRPTAPPSTARTASIPKGRER